MLRDSNYEEISDEIQEADELSETLNSKAEDLAEGLIAGGAYRVPRELLASAGGLDSDSRQLDLFALRTRYFLQKGWRVMAVCEKGGLRILTEAERAAEAARRCRLGVRKVIRAQNALKATDTSKLTRAQMDVFDAAEQAVSRRARALRAAGRM
jgi:hypothetical protein